MRSFTSLSLALATSQGPENAAPGWLHVPAVSPQPQVHISCLPSSWPRSVDCTGACARSGDAANTTAAASATATGTMCQNLESAVIPSLTNAAVSSDTRASARFAACSLAFVFPYQSLLPRPDSFTESSGEATIAPPSISSVSYGDHDSLLRTPSLLEGGRVPTQVVGLNLRPRNDSGRPAPDRPEAATTAFVLAAASTTAPPACAPPSPWPALCVGALPAGDNPAATLRRLVPRSPPLPPTACAEKCCLAC